MMNESTNRNPLWLPEGSVRAIMAIGLTGAVIALAVLGREPPDALTTVAGMVLGYYFGVKKGGG